jgi:Kef-type K+ transport system membrane component KefB
VEQNLLFSFFWIRNINGYEKIQKEMHTKIVSKTNFLVYKIKNPLVFRGFYFWFFNYLIKKYIAKAKHIIDINIIIILALFFVFCYF